MFSPKCRPWIAGVPLDANAFAITMQSHHRAAATVDAEQGPGHISQDQQLASTNFAR